MDRRIDVETLRTGLDEIIASTTADTRIVIQKNGHHVAMLVSMPDQQPTSPQADNWLQAMWNDVKARGLPPITMDEIDDEIAAYRREKREAAARE